MKQFYLFILMMASCAVAQAQTGDSIALDNGVIRREIVYSDGHLYGKSYALHEDGTQFINDKSPEFSVAVNGVTCTGASDWSDFQRRDTVDRTGGKGVILTLKQKDFAVELIYLLYPKLPVVYKSMRVINTGDKDLKVEAADVENLQLHWGDTDTWIMRQYGRYQWLGPYVGNWDDPLLIVHDTGRNIGIAIGNEATGVTKRTSVFLDGRSITAGLTYPDQTYPFRKWIRPAEQWTSPRVFTAVYANSVDAFVPLNTTVPDFVRRHTGMRIEQLDKKPMFVYNTWIPFVQNIDEQLILELAQAAAECGVEEFVIDDGWQTGQVYRTAKDGEPTSDSDWDIDRKKFPNGLRPVFDHIRSLGMKPGLWLSLATADINKKDNREHHEWFVVDKKGELGNLHTEHGYFKTACMGTGWYDYIRDVVLRMVDEHGLAYVKLDLAIVTSAYVYDTERTGCYATDHPWHRDREESFGVIYDRCMTLFDELHRCAPELFIDCTFETAGKLQLMDYGIAKHAEGNWLSNVGQQSPVGPLRIRHLAWGRSPTLPASSLVIGNLQMDAPNHRLSFKSLAGSLPIMLGDPRKLSVEERQWFKTWSGWLKELEQRHSIMSFRQDLPGYGEPGEGRWDAFSRINTETNSGGLVGVFRHGAVEDTRTVTVPWLDPDRTYIVRQGAEGKITTTMTGRELSEKGFSVTLTEKYDGELFELVGK